MLMLFLVTGCNTQQKSHDTASVVAVASCDVPLPVIDWSESGTPTEGIEGIAEERC